MENTDRAYTDYWAEGCDRHKFYDGTHIFHVLVEWQDEGGRWWSGAACNTNITLGNITNEVGQKCRRCLALLEKVKARAER